MKLVAKKPAKSFARGQAKVKRGLSRMVATRLPRQAQAQEIPLGRFHAGPVVVPCAIGRAGIRQDKREGDRATPGGAFRLLGGFFRADRVLRKAWGSPMRPAGPSDGWCDDPRRKNRGSAIFIHCARPDFAPTWGCIALRLDDLRRLLPRLACKAVLTVR